MNHYDAIKLARRMRNEHKRRYALLWIEFLEGRTSRPERGELSAMGAQAVMYNFAEYAKSLGKEADGQP